MSGYQETPDPSVLDNKVLDEFEVPFGAWGEQAVDWIDVNLDWLLDGIKWPFDYLLTHLVDDFLVEISWVWIVLGFFLLGWLVRNISVGAFGALALAGCGVLGNAYWLETARTIGYIFVAVLLCVVIGVPIGVACGRMDALWKVVRPILDAMQVVHSFVYMLPFIFFFGIGAVPATMVTMVFALPPLIRLTNLGIRQVPEDVVEASRAYGAPEWRVLADVQLPLARPAIMTGLNQTLLLAISMLGIAAIMGAGGLGRLLFRALTNQDVALATSAGLAFFLVAVALDRVSQGGEDDSGNLAHRIRRAWAHRRDPEVLIPDDRPVAPEPTAPHFARITAPERRWMTLTGVGSVIALVSVVLPWTSDAGKYSAFGRRTDEDLVGESFSGLSASGGSWFGYLVVGLALFALVSVVVTWRTPGRGPRWMTADGAAIASIALAATMLAYVLGSAPARAATSTGVGVWVALVGAAVATAGAVLWLWIAPHSPLHPLRAEVAWGRLIGVGLAVVTLAVGAVSGWSFDARQDAILSPEIQAQIAELNQKAEDNPADAGPIAAELSALMSSARSEGTVVTDGLSSDGPGLGLWTLLAGLGAFGAALPAIGLFGRDERGQWVWTTICAGLGAGAVAIATGWIATHVRSADPNFVSGVGSFLALLGGFFVIGSAMSVLGEFRRTLVYDDDLPSGRPAPAAAEEPVEVSV